MSEDATHGATSPATEPAPHTGEPTPVVPAAVGRPSVQVPVWALAVLALVVIGAGAFLLGRATAPAYEGPATLAEAAEEAARGEMPVGDLDPQALLRALGENDGLDLGIIGDLLLGGGRG